VGCVEQKPVVDSSGKAQMQPVLHGWSAPQLPPQVKFLDSVRSWWAEIVPAQRTAVTMSAGNILRKAFMITLLYGLIGRSGDLVLAQELLTLRRAELSGY
jgi:hypothetical protein